MYNTELTAFADLNPPVRPTGPDLTRLDPLPGGRSFRFTFARPDADPVQFLLSHPSVAWFGDVLAAPTTIVVGEVRVAQDAADPAVWTVTVGEAPGGGPRRLVVEFAEVHRHEAGAHHDAEALGVRAVGVQPAVGHGQPGRADAEPSSPRAWRYVRASRQLSAARTVHLRPANPRESCCPRSARHLRQSEPFGIAPLEAMAYQIPCVVTNGWALKELGYVRIIRRSDFRSTWPAPRSRSGGPVRGSGRGTRRSPEQLAGSEVTARSDLFSLGLILYELLTGERPFPGRTRAEVRRQHAEMAPRPPTELVRGLDPAWDRVVLRCLAREPRHRPGSAREVKEALPPLSPKETEQGGGEGLLRPRVALTLLAAALLGVLANARLAPSTMAFHQVGPVKSPNALRDRASDLAREFGYTGPVKMDAEALEWDSDLILHATRRRTPAWPDTTDRATPPLYFWYRAGPLPLVSTYRVTPADPPMTVPGMVCVMLDPRGNLVEFHAVPERLPGPAVREESASCERLLAAAGLNPDEFRKGPPARRPPVFADASWSYARADGGGPRADVAVCDGRPVYFRLAAPFGANERPDRADADLLASSQIRQRKIGEASLTVMLVTLVLATPVMLRNLRHGRCDVPTAVRLAVIYLACSLASWALTANHAPELDAERSLLMNLGGMVGFWCVFLVVMYVTLEPYMRRRWPERLTSWSRLLAGRLGNPMVGRDVLIGVAIGTAMALVSKATAAAAGTFVLFTPGMEILGPDAPPGMLVFLATVALLRAVLGFGYLVVLGLVLRRERLALLLLAAIVAMNTQIMSFTLDGRSWVAWAGCAALGLLVAVTIARFGLVPTLAAHFTYAVICNMPLTTSPEPWYAGTAALSAAVLVGLAVCGFFVSLGGQKLIPDEF